MSAMRTDQVLLLCAGLQSSGSTLVSWCFLQRGDTDGVLDANGDMIPQPPEGLKSEYLWYKTTISSFRLTEMVTLAEDAGYRVRPLLVVRDVRAVWASLAGKRYGANGTTAEDPPLRLRLRRFLEDWEEFVARGWPRLQYEAFVREPQAELEKACSALGLPWDGAMMSWPKPAEDIADRRHGNPTFLKSRRGGLLESLDRGGRQEVRGAIGGEDLAWMEQEFRAFNEANGYPAHVEGGAAHAGRAQPSFASTRRAKWRRREKPLRAMLWALGLGRQP